MRPLPAALALAALAACDPVSSAFDPSQDFARRAAAHAADTERVAALPATGLDGMPVTGSVTYAGTAALVADTEAATSLVGDAELLVAFEDDTLTGTVRDVTGTVEGGPVEDLAGTLVLDDGDLRVGAPGAFTADIEGTLTGRDAVVGVDGEIGGTFRGADAEALLAVSSPATDVTVDGVEVGGTLSVVAER